MINLFSANAVSPPKVSEFLSSGFIDSKNCEVVHKDY